MRKKKKYSGQELETQHREEFKEKRKIFNIEKEDKARKMTLQALQRINFATSKSKSESISTDQKIMPNSLISISKDVLNYIKSKKSTKGKNVKIQSLLLLP